MCFPIRRVLFLFFLSFGGAPLAFTQTQEITADKGAWSTFSDMVDRLPAALAERLPGLDPDGAVRVYFRPHLGDFFHNDYIRLPIGLRAKITDRIQANAEILGFFAHGIDVPEKEGVAMLNLGGKIENVFPAWNDGGVSFGFDYRTPLGNAPLKFTDGYRHFQPYVAATRMLVPKWGLLGYASFGLNLIQRDPHLPSNFGRNQLHSDSLAMSDGVTKRWKRFQFSLTARVATTALMSDDIHENFWLHPEIVIPLRRETARTQIFFTLDGHVMWGPEGRQTGSGGGVRVEFHLNHAAPKTTAALW